MSEKARKILKFTLIGLAALIVVAVVAAGLYWNHLLNLIGDADQTVPTLSYEEEMALLGVTETTEATEATEPTETTVPVETEPPLPDKYITNIMLVGQNWREDEQNKLSDTMILCSINRKTKTMTMVSFLRDLYIALPAYAGHGPGRNRINVCYALGSSWQRSSIGGMEMLALCIEQNFGIHVDHTIEVSFESFPRIIDGFGGVEVDVTEAEANYLNKDDLYVTYDVQPGLQYLDGMAALSYARMRKAEGDGDSDIVRTSRQRRLIGALFEKVRWFGLQELQSVADTLLPLITTTMTPKDVADILIRMLPHLSDLKIQGGSMPVETTYRGELVDIFGDGMMHSVLKFDAEQNKRLIREFAEADNIS